MSDHYIYIICKIDESGDFCSPVKVGMTRDPMGRFATIQTSCPFDISIFNAFVLPTKQIAYELEKSFHLVQKEKRLKGEWFDMHPGLAYGMMSMNIAVFMKTRVNLSFSQAWHSLPLCGITGNVLELCQNYLKLEYGVSGHEAPQ